MPILPVNTKFYILARAMMMTNACHLKIGNDWQIWIGLKNTSRGRIRFEGKLWQKKRKIGAMTQSL